MQNPEEYLIGCFGRTLVPHPEQMKAAEESLKIAANQPLYGIEVLKLLSLPSLDESIRQAAAVNFKNHIKYRWSPSEPDLVPGIQDPEKDQIKQYILPLMIESPPKVQSQLSEALTIISGFDFPRKWETLLPNIVANLKSATGYDKINGMLRTVDSIFKKFRYEYRSNDLLLDLKYCLDNFAAPLLERFLATGHQIRSTNDLAILRLLFEAQQLCCEIFYSLNFQDLPEFFEDHMKEWMDEFHYYLRYFNPALDEKNPEQEGIVDQLKAAVCENINLYMEKCEEEFKDYLKDFTADVWQLLMSAKLTPGHDRLATTSIKFLITISKSVHHSLFSDAGVLKQICESIVIPNVRIRSEDEELFESNPFEYIRKDMEGSDIDTRRRMACELVKGLLTHYKEQVTVMFRAYIQSMLEKYMSNPVENWREKDCAIYLVVALAPKQASVGALGTDLVNVEQFYVAQIAPELHAENVNLQPLLKADALKFVTTFRGHIPKPMALGLIPQLVRFLVAESNVVHSYAATCIGKMLLIRDGKEPRISSADLAGYQEILLYNLFSALRLPESQENQYVMKCVMRVASKVDLGQASPQVLDWLVGILEEVCKNPRNPNFNHYAFETVAAMLKNSCEKHPELVLAFESKLFPVFQAVLVQDITEFAPYVFQILAQLIEIRTPPIPATYMQIFPALLTPSLWERSANVPALVRLLQAFLQKAPDQINQSQWLTQVLGVFEKLVGLRNSDYQGIFIINTIIENVSFQVLSKYMVPIWSTLFTRLQKHRTVRFVKSFVIFVSLFVVKNGTSVLVDSINSVNPEQPNLFLSVLEHIWIPNLSTISGSVETKLCIVAASKVLCESPILLAEQALPLWGKLLNSMVTLLVRPEEERAEENAGEPDLDEIVGYSAVYTELYNASKKEDDPVKEIQDAKQFLCVSLSRVSSQVPGKLPVVIKQYVDPSIQEGLAQLCCIYGTAIV